MRIFIMSCDAFVMCRNLYVILVTILTASRGKLDSLSTKFY